MTKVEIYRLRDILHEMRYIKQADTDPTATHDRFVKAYKEGVKICDKNIGRMKPLEVKMAECKKKLEKKKKVRRKKNQDGNSITKIRKKLHESRERSFLKRGTRWPDKWSRGYKMGDEN